MKQLLIVMALIAILFSAVAAAETAPAGNAHMQAASADLQAAQLQLGLAPSDKAGRRAKAVSLVNQALKEVQASLPEPKKY